MQLRLPAKKTTEEILVELYDRDEHHAMFARTHVDVDTLLHELHQFERLSEERLSRIRSREGLHRGGIQGWKEASSVTDVPGLAIGRKIAQEGCVLERGTARRTLRHLIYGIPL